MIPSSMRQSPPDPPASLPCMRSASLYPLLFAPHSPLAKSSSTSTSCSAAIEYSAVTLYLLVLRFALPLIPEMADPAAPDMLPPVMRRFIMPDPRPSPPPLEEPASPANPEPEPVLYIVVMVRALRCPSADGGAAERRVGAAQAHRAGSETSEEREGDRCVKGRRGSTRCAECSRKSRCCARWRMRRDAMRCGPHRRHGRVQTPLVAVKEASSAEAATRGCVGA